MTFPDFFIFFIEQLFFIFNQMFSIGSFGRLGSGITPCLFNLILYVPLTIFQLCRDGSSWVEPILHSDKCELLKDIIQ